MAAAVSGNDQFEGVRKCAAIRHAIAGERGDHLSYFQIPHLQRLVKRGRDRPLPVRRHGHWPSTCPHGTNRRAQPVRRVHPHALPVPGQRNPVSIGAGLCILTTT